MRAVVLCAVLLPAGAARAGDGEQAASFGVAPWATYATPGTEEDETVSPHWGAGVTAGYERGFGADVAWRVDLIAAAYAADDRAGELTWAGTALATAGLTYRVDVLKYVPYVEVGVGALVRTGGPFEAGVEPALRLGGGIDWLRGRARSHGIAVAMTSFASDTTTVSVSVRSTWRWGYF